MHISFLKWSIAAAPVYPLYLEHCFSYRGTHLASVQSLVRVANKHYLTGRM